MSEKPKVLIVDDSPEEIRLLMEMLRQEFAVLAATNGSQALASLQRGLPDLVLMDVEMRPLNGYEVCSAIRENHADLPIVFLSAHSKLEDILAGYDAGGQDFLTKPVVPQLLSQRLNVCLSQARDMAKLRSQNEEVSTMAMAAMGNAADIGIVLNFVREGIKLHNQSELVERITHTLRQYGLVGLAQVRSGDQFWNASTSGQVAALETEVLNRASEMEQRLIVQGTRLIINYGFVTLMVKNHPVDNQKRAGELCDYLTILTENANDLIQKIRDDLAEAEQRVSLVMEAMRDAQMALVEIQTFQKQYKADRVLLIDQLCSELELEFAELHLTIDQEQSVVSLMRSKVSEALDMNETAMQLDDQLQRITDSLGQLTRSF